MITSTAQDPEEDPVDGTRRWTDDIWEWTGMTLVECIRTAEDTVTWRVVTSSSMACDLQQ